MSSDASEAPMNMTIARLNIEHFQRKLSEENDDAKRQTLLHLLAEEEAKLAELVRTSKERVRA
jgi:hypothetical protein